MKKAEEYTNWKGPYSFQEIRNLNLPNNTLVWFKSRCEDEERKEHPSKCVHYPITLTKYFEDYNNHDEDAYYHINASEKTSKADWLNHKTAIISLVAAIITLIVAFKQCGDEVTSDSPKANTNCNCEYQDVSVKSSGKRYKFRVVYLTREKKWKFESTELLETNEKVEDVLPDFINNIPDFQSSLGVVAVGLASQEGKIQEEEARATERADKIADVLRTASASKELYTLSLGQYLVKEKIDKKLTGYQRRVILIGILEKEAESKKIEIEKALRLALRDTEGLNFTTERYSNFQFDKVK